MKQRDSQLEAAEAFIRAALSHFKGKSPTEREIRKAAHKAAAAVAPVRDLSVSARNEERRAA
jgi:hypothetical protein